jgi:hypothetical protein
LVVLVGVLWLGWSTVGPRADSKALPLVVGGFAEDFVATFLTTAGEGAEQSLQPFLGYLPALAGMTPGSFYATRTTARELRQTDNGWTVIVRADLLTRTDGGYVPLGPRNYSVRIVEDPEVGLRAASLPGPSPARPPGIEEQPRQYVLPDDEQLVTAVSDYLDWYLTGSAPIAGVIPAGGFEATELVHFDAGEERATAGVLATLATGHTMRIDVALIRSGGSWRALELSPESS